MTATAPPPEALATAPKAIVISQFDVLLGDIAEAKAKAADVTFNYADPKGNTAARSYIYQQRKLNARIESARADAKAYALAYGRTVDSQAAGLKDQVQALIKPHQDAIDAIAKAKADRVQRHRDVIDGIRAMGSVLFGASSAAIARWLEEAKAIDVDSLEEFTDEGKAALVDTLRALEAAHAKALADEAAAAELEQLREQQRIQREKDAEDARIKAHQEAVDEAARKAQEEADAAALLVIEEADKRVAEAQARADAAEAALTRQQAIDAARDQEEADKTARAMHLEEMALAVGEDPEPPATMAARFTRSGPVPPSAGPTYPGMGRLRSPAETDAAEAAKGGYEAKRRLRQSLNAALAGMLRGEVTDALVDGTLHPAVKIDWSLV